MAHAVNLMRPVHPGEVLREDYLAPLGLSVNALSVALGVPATRIHEIVKDPRSSRDPQRWQARQRTQQQRQLAPVHQR